MNKPSALSPSPQKVHFKHNTSAINTPNYDSDSQLDFQTYQQLIQPVYESKLISPLMKKKKKDILSARRIQQKEHNKFL